MVDTTFVHRVTPITAEWLNNINDAIYGPFPSNTLGSQLADSTSVSNGDALIAVKKTATGSVARTQHQINEENLSLKDLGAVGDGVTNDDAAITAAAALSQPIYVPYTSSFYAVTSLPDAVRSRLWGPGEIRVSGTITEISSVPYADSSTKPFFSLNDQAQTPTANVTLGSVARGLGYLYGKRTGGAGQYGNLLVESLVTAGIVPGEFDVSFTSWISATNMTGAGSFIYGAWTGANTPFRTQTYTGGGVVGQEINVGNRWGDLGFQADLGGTRYTVGLQVVPDVIPSTDTQSTTVTMSSGTPGVVNWTAHGLVANTPVYFGGSGTLPVALTAGTTYYVMAAGLGANSFQVSATRGGGAINFAQASSGTITALSSHAGSFGVALGPSIHDHRWWIGYLQRYDTIEPLGYAFQIAGGGSASYNNPQALIKALGYWVDGVDLSGGVYSGTPLKFNSVTLNTGYGTPTNVSKTINLPGTAATLAQVGGTLAALIVQLKLQGICTA